MHIEVLAIGDEILKGNIVNSNAAFISKELFERGYHVAKHEVIGDIPEKIKSTLKEALKQADVVIVSGGLGPTLDDITKSVMGEVFETPYVFNANLHKELLERFPDLLTAKELSTVPQSAKILPNILGTAPGFVFCQGKKLCAFLPGVPSEMEAMFNYFLDDYLVKQFPVLHKGYRRVLDICLHNEDEIQASFMKDLPKKQDLHIGIYPYYGGVRVELESNLSSKHEVEKIEKKLLTAFPDTLFSNEGKSIQLVIKETCERQKLSLAVAESCTGGAIAASLTTIPGSSSYFLGSIVAYADEVKEQVLRVSPKTLKEKGAVSPETIREMLDGIFAITKADLALAVSGIAGPGGSTRDKPVGTVWMGVAKRGEKFDIGKILAPPGRKAVVQCTVNTILGILWRRIIHNKLYFNGK